MQLNPYSKASLHWLADGPEEQYDLFFDIGHLEGFAGLATECFGSLSEGLSLKAGALCQALLAGNYEILEDAYFGEHAGAIRQMAREALKESSVDVVPAQPWIPRCLCAFDADVKIGEWFDSWDGRPREFNATLAGPQVFRCKFFGFRRLFASVAMCFTCSIGEELLPVTLAMSDDRLLPYCLVLPVRGEEMEPPNYGSLRSWVMLMDGY